MTVFKKIAAAVLGLSFVTFVALFGRLPTFRKTPIGFLHRLIWIHLPAAFSYADRRISGGQLTLFLSYLGHYLLNEKHPLVLGFFLALLGVSEIMFIPPAWKHLSSLHHVLLPVAVTLPYCLLYRTVASNSSIITSENHQDHMCHYPYDYVLFHPGHVCRTCRFLKPARSKHCSICKACVAKHDHHCAWVNNCLGRGNYGYFVALLLTLSLLLTYGAYLGHAILAGMLQHSTMGSAQVRTSRSGWSSSSDWSTYFNSWAYTFTQHVRIGSVALLTLMTAPLTWGLFLYHVYLIWAGMTTNESHKWADWRDDMVDGVVYKGRRCLETDVVDEGSHAVVGPKLPWPVQTDQLLIRAENGLPPGLKATSGHDAKDAIARLESRYQIREWVQVRKLEDIDNIYDLGFWDNLKDIFRTQ